MSTKDFADQLIFALEDAKSDYDLCEARDKAGNLKHLERAREDLRQALRVPSTYSEEFLTPRDEFAMSAPVRIADVLRMVPSCDLSRDGDRRGIWAIMAALRVEYADAMIAALKAREVKP